MIGGWKILSRKQSILMKPEELVKRHQTLSSQVGSGHETTSRSEGVHLPTIFCLRVCVCIRQGIPGEESHTLLQNTVAEHTCMLPCCCLHARFDRKLNLIIGSYVIFIV